jgi:hypothetical protein
MLVSSGLRLPEVIRVSAYHLETPRPHGQRATSRHENWPVFGVQQACSVCGSLQEMRTAMFGSKRKRVYNAPQETAHDWCAATQVELSRADIRSEIVPLAFDFDGRLVHAPDDPHWLLAA